MTKVRRSNLSRKRKIRFNKSLRKSKKSLKRSKKSLRRSKKSLKRKRMKRGGADFTKLGDDSKKKELIKTKLLSKELDIHNIFWSTSN